MGRNGLRHFLDFIGADAGRADPNAFSGAINKGADGLEVNVPAAISDIVRVADPIAELRAATADFANLCHKTGISRWS